MKQRAFRQNTTGYVLSKKARPRLRGQAAMSMNYTMYIIFILLSLSPGGSMTCRAKFVVFCGFSVRAGAVMLPPMKGAVETA